MKTMIWLAVCWLLVPVAGAQTVDRNWTATSALSQQQLARGESWSTVTTTLVRRTGSGAVSVDWSRIRLDARSDRSVGANLYRGLWKGAYASTRVQMAGTQTILPRLDLSTQVNQAFGAWEAGLAYRVRMFAVNTVHVISASAARYHRDWLLFARISALPDPYLSGSIRFGARRYFSNPLNYIELAAGAGREAIAVSSQSAAVLRAWSVSVRAQRFMTGTIGVTAGLSHVRGTPLTRSGAELGILTRW